MARISTSEVDDELFDEVYGKEYTGPPGLLANSNQEKTFSNKRPHRDGEANGGSDNEDEPHDPNGVPTDFTSREAKVWVAKAKAAERNWKKRKEEEMICKLCGLSGHFTQGCPSTLGANRKSAEFFRRIPARDKHMRVLFTEKVINRIERDNGCKIKMDEKFIIVSSKNQSGMTKGVDAVHLVIEDDKLKGSSSSRRERSKSPHRSPARSQFRQPESDRRSHLSPRRAPQLNSSKQDKDIDDNLRRDQHMQARRSTQARAYGNNEGRGQSSDIKSPSTFPGDVYSPYGGDFQKLGMNKNDGWDVERNRSEVPSSRKFEVPTYPQTLEELEVEFKREAIEFGTIRDKEEDEENYKHREAIRAVRETYMKKLALVRGAHAKQWQEFLQFEIQRQQDHQRMSMSNYDAYNRSSYLDYDGPSGNPPYLANILAMDPRSRYPYPIENYSTSRPSHDSYAEFQRQKHEDVGKAYNRY